MPELIEVEYYRRLADRLVGSEIAGVETPDAWFLKRGADAGQVDAALRDATITGTRRIGKLLLVDLDEDRPVLGLRFGMTGRLVLDGDAPIDHLEYSSDRDEPHWNRFAIRTREGERLRLSDPRRLGGVELDPDHHELGPDAWTITPDQLGHALRDARAPLKARLLDQRRIAGLGNLLVDEILWRLGLDPATPAGRLGPASVGALARSIRRTVDDLAERGGSHRGDLHEQRHRDGVCPTDGTPLDRRTIGGRTTYSCPHHQHGTVTVTDPDHR